MGIRFNQNSGANSLRAQKAREAKEAEAKQESKEAPKASKNNEAVALKNKNVSSQQVFEYLEMQAQVQKAKVGAKRNAPERIKQTTDSDREVDGNNDRIDDNMNPNHFGRGSGGFTFENDSTRAQNNRDYAERMREPWVTVIAEPAVPQPKDEGPAEQPIYEGDEE